MKKITLCFSLIASFTLFAQQTFTFIGGTNGGDWTESANWSGGIAPGNTISAMDTVEILGDVIASIPSNIIITNNGTIEISNTMAGFPIFNIFALGTLINNGDLDISNATMTIAGTLDNQNIIDSFATDVSVSSGGSLMNFDEFVTRGTITRLLLNEGTITNSTNANMTLGTNTDNSGIFTNTGLINITAGDFTNRAQLTNNQELNIVSPAGLTNASGATFDNFGDITIDDFSLFINQGNLTNNLAGEITILEVSRLRLSPSSTSVNQGTINITSGELDIDESFTNDGDIINEDRINIASSTVLTNNGTIINNNSVIVEFGNSITFIPFINTENGDLEGNNTTAHADNISNSGTISPGNDLDVTGGYDISGNLNLFSSTVLNIEIESLTDFDTLEADNISFVDTVNPTNPNPAEGTLNVSLLNNFDPAIGETFTIVNATSTFSDPINGTFETINFPTFNGKTFMFDDEEDDPNPNSNLDYNTTPNSSTIVLRVIDVSALSTNGFTKNTFKLYPNPSKNYLAINTLNTTEEATVYSYTGQRLLSSEISPENNKIDTSSLPSGVYFVKIKNASQKFIKL